MPDMTMFAKNGRKIKKENYSHIKLCERFIDDKAFLFASINKKADWEKCISSQLICLKK